GVHPRQVIEEASAALDAVVRPGPELARPLQRALRDAMWAHAGVTRDEAGLRKGLDAVDAISAMVCDVDVRPSAEGWSDLAQLVDLHAGLLVARATLQCALVR